MSATVLDASAVLCLLADEPGAENVAAALGSGRCALSAVNLAEVVAKLAARGLSPDEVAAVVDRLGTEIIAFDREQAIDSGLLIGSTKAAGLSLGDRACLALARKLGAPALTTDSAWGRIDLGIAITLLR